MIRHDQIRESTPERRRRIEETGDLWWKNSIIYCLDIETFLDSNGDGIGDVDGLTERIDYLDSIGVDCLWLMPFYPTPNRDDGYDIIDYYGVAPELGQLGELVEMVRTAADRGIRVIADLVVNHTSSQHRWFQRARQDRDSPYRDYYVWRDEPTELDSVMFPGQQESNWAYDEAAGQYYLHRFFAHQPDLNPANPRVREEIAEIAGFWLQQGLAGFRVDAVPYLTETHGIECPTDIVQHQLLRELRQFLTRRRGDLVLLGEVNRPAREAAAHFGGGDELNMVLNFEVNQKLYLSLARHDASPLRDCLESLPDIPYDCQWANFVCNHDELTLDQLDEDERKEVFAAFAPDPTMRLWGRGIRRRPPSMLGGDRRRLELLYSLLLSLPGTPIVYYGEEIGMAENLDIEGRRAVRGPMQWSGDRAGGFSVADELRRPPTRGRFRPAKINVVEQRRDSRSFLNWFSRMCRRRRECPELGFGAWQLLPAEHTAVIAHRCDWYDSTVVAVHNLSDRELDVTLKLELPADFVELIELESDRETRIAHPPSGIHLAPYGYAWYRVRRQGRLPML